MTQHYMTPQHYMTLQHYTAPYLGHVAVCPVRLYVTFHIYNLSPITAHITTEVQEQYLN